MTEISRLYYEWKMGDLNNTMEEYGFDEKFYESVKTDILENTERMEVFSNFCGIETINQMMELGIDGIRFGVCENGYENLYRLSRKCFKGQSFRDSFSSGVLYYFWENFAWDRGLMCVKTYSDGKVICFEPERQVS